MSSLLSSPWRWIWCQELQQPFVTMRQQNQGEKRKCWEWQRGERGRAHVTDRHKPCRLLPTWDISLLAIYARKLEPYIFKAAVRRFGGCFWELRLNVFTVLTDHTAQDFGLPSSLSVLKCISLNLPILSACFQSSHMPWGREPAQECHFLARRTRPRCLHEQRYLFSFSLKCCH